MLRLPTSVSGPGDNDSGQQSSMELRTVREHIDYTETTLLIIECPHTGIPQRSRPRQQYRLSRDIQICQ